MSLRILLLLPLVASVLGEADPWVDNDLYYGTVFQGEVAYSAGPTHTRVKPKAEERTYVEAPATYIQSEVQPAYLTHQYQQPAPVFTTGYSPLAYQLQIPYSAPAPIVTHSNYAAPPVPVETVAVSHRAEPLPVAVATPTNYVEPVAVATPTNYVEPLALAAQTDPVAAVAVASHGDYPSVSSSQYHSQDEMGNYAFGYNNVNGAREEEGNSLTGVRGSYTGAGGNTVHYVADQWGFRLV